LRPTVIRAADCRRTSWRNGGGETVEVAVHPPSAALDAFDWRISSAGVAADGPFSDFPGVDRTLLVLTGDAITLSVAGRPPVLIDRRSAPFSFPGDSPATASLIDGSITDLNVMTRRGRFRHAVDRLDLDAPVVVARGEGECVVFCCTGRIDHGGPPLEPGDALMLSGPCSLAPMGGSAAAAIIRIWADRGPPPSTWRRSA